MQGGPARFEWRRYYGTRHVNEQRGNGWGHRHEFDRWLRFDLDGVRYERPNAETVEFGRLARPGDRDTRQGHVLERVSEDLYQVRRTGSPSYEFRCGYGPKRRVALLTRMYEGLHEARFEYDGHGRLVGVVDYEQRTLRVEWSREGRLSGVVWLSPEGQRQLVSYEYDRFGFLLGGRDAYGKAFSYSYDDAGYMTRKVNRRGHGFTYEYDTQGRCTRGRGDNGEVALLMAYFPTKQCTLVTHEESGAQWWYRYVPEGTVTEIEDPYGGIRTFRLDERGQPVAEVDAAGQVYPYVRDAAGAPLGKRDPLGHIRPLDALPHELAEALQYEGPEAPLEWEHGRLVPLGFEVPWSGSLPPQVPAQARAALAGAEVAGVVREERDAHDTLVRVDKPMAGGVHRRTYRYDGTGNLERYTDFDGGTWEYVYREWTQHAEARDPLGAVTRFERSGWDDLLGVVDAGGTESRYEYDLKRRLTAVHRHDKVRERYEYDAVDRLTAKVRGDGTPLVQYTRGPGALLRKRATSDGQEETFEHDARGHKTLAANAAGTCRFEHTPSGRRKADLRDDEGVRVRFAGERVLGITTLGLGVQYHYPSTDTVLVVDPTDRVHRIHRLGAGIVQRDLASGTTEVSQHDGQGHCLSKTAFESGADAKRPAWTRRFWRSGEGDLLAREDSLRGTTRYTHDAAHALVGVTHPDGRQDEYAHDAARNLLTKPGLTSGRTDLPPGMYAAWDTTHVGLTANRLYRANGDRFFYDARDHLSAREGAWGRLGYEHDALDRLRRVTFAARDATQQPPEPVGREERHEHVYGAPETVWEADYDPLGRRTETRVYGAVDASGERVCARSRFWWHGDRLAAEEGPTGSLRVYVYVDERALVPFMAVDYASREEAAERPQDGERHYYFTDHRGCPERVEDDDGEVVWEATIHPYGECEVHVGADFHQPLRFPGHYHDATTGLHCNRFRYYSPELGRYLESDPIGVQGGLNLYAYCGEGNPLRDVDLRGLNKPCPGNCPPSATPEEGADAEGTATPARGGDASAPPRRGDDALGADDHLTSDQRRHFRDRINNAERSGDADAAAQARYDRNCTSRDNRGMEHRDPAAWQADATRAQANRDGSRGPERDGREALGRHLGAEIGDNNSGTTDRTGGTRPDGLGRRPDGTPIVHDHKHSRTDNPNNPQAVSESPQLRAQRGLGGEHHVTLTSDHPDLGGTPPRPRPTGPLGQSQSNVHFVETAPPPGGGDPVPTVTHSWNRQTSEWQPATNGSGASRVKWDPASRQWVPAPE